MTTVFILGDKNDSSPEQLIKSELTNNYHVFYIGDKSVFEFGKGYELLIIDAERIINAEVGRTIVMLKREAVLKKLCFGENATVIAFSENEKQIKCLKGASCNIITCGFQKTDTISYTSISDEKIMVSLNRELTALSGRKILPLEFPLTNMQNTDVYSLLAFTALRLLLDDYGSDIGQLY